MKAEEQYAGGCIDWSTLPAAAEWLRLHPEFVALMLHASARQLPTRVVKTPPEPPVL